MAFRYCDIRLRRFLDVKSRLAIVRFIPGHSLEPYRGSVVFARSSSVVREYHAAALRKMEAPAWPANHLINLMPRAEVGA